MLNDELKRDEALRIMIKERDKWQYMLNVNPKLSISMKSWAQNHIDAYNTVIKLINKEIQDEEIINSCFVMRDRNSL